MLVFGKVVGREINCLVLCVVCYSVTRFFYLLGKIKKQYSISVTCRLF